MGAVGFDSGKVRPIEYGNVMHNGKRWRVHRLAYALAFGPIPNGMMVCHRCDMSVCINPDHLFVGTATDNVRDCIAKGRFVNNGGPKPIAPREDLEAIRSAVGSQRQIAARFGISQSTVGRILRREAWANF